MKRLQANLNTAHFTDENSKPATDVVGGDTFFALCQLHNVCVHVLIPITGERSVPINTDDEDGAEQLWREIETVDNMSMNQQEQSCRRIGMVVVDVLNRPSHVEPLVAYQRLSSKTTPELLSGWCAEGRDLVIALVKEKGEPKVGRGGHCVPGAVTWEDITEEYNKRTAGWKGEPKRMRLAVCACWQHTQGKETAVHKNNEKRKADLLKERERTGWADKRKVKKVKQE